MKIKLMAALTLLVVLVASFMLATNTGRRVDTATDTESQQVPLEGIGDSPKTSTFTNQNQEQAAVAKLGQWLNQDLRAHRGQTGLMT